MAISGRGTMTRRAVFSSRLSTFSIITRSFRERCPPAALSARMCRSSSSVCDTSAGSVRPRPRSQSVRLLAVLSKAA